jgi:hypothetical protein
MRSTPFPNCWKSTRTITRATTLIHSLGGFVSCTHPARWWTGAWGGKGIFPLDENQFISNMATELPFDAVAGPP